MRPASSPCRYPSVRVPVFLFRSLFFCPCPCRCLSIPVPIPLSLSLSPSFCPCPCLFCPCFFALFPSLCPSVAVPVPLSLSLLNRDKNRDGKGEKGVAKYLIAEHKCSPECGSVNGYTSLHSWRKTSLILHKTPRYMNYEDFFLCHIFETSNKI